MKTIKLTVKITFDGSISKSQVREVVGNTLQALVMEAQGGMGLAPDSSEVVTKKIEVMGEGNFEEWEFPELPTKCKINLK